MATTPGTGTREAPWQLQTPGGRSEFTAYRDESPTRRRWCARRHDELRYDLRASTTCTRCSRAHGDWMPLGSADEQKPAADGTVEAWARSPDNPVGGWYGLKKGLRGRFAIYVPPVMEALGPRRGRAPAAQQPHARRLASTSSRARATSPTSSVTGSDANAVGRSRRSPSSTSRQRAGAPSGTASSQADGGRRSGERGTAQRAQRPSSSRAKASTSARLERVDGAACEQVGIGTARVEGARDDGLLEPAVAPVRQQRRRAHVPERSEVAIERGEIYGAAIVRVDEENLPRSVPW